MMFRKLLGFALLCTLLGQTDASASAIHPLNEEGLREDLILNHLVPRLIMREAIQKRLVSKSWNDIWDSNEAWKAYGQRIPGFERARELTRSERQGNACRVPVNYKDVFRKIVTPEFYSFPVPEGLCITGRMKISLEGNVVIAYMSDNMVGIWTSKGKGYVYQSLSPFKSSIRYMSANGNILIGATIGGKRNNIYRPCVWTKENEEYVSQPLEGLKDNERCSISGMSTDGQTIIGFTEETGAGPGNPISPLKAITWVKEKESQKYVRRSLNNLKEGNTSYPLRVSADGSVVVGNSNTGQKNNVDKAVIWVKEGKDYVIQSLDPFNQYHYSNATRISENGQVVVGSTKEPAKNIVWTQKNGIQFLNSLNGGQYNTVREVSADGSVIIGEAGDGQDNDAIKAVIWEKVKESEEYRIRSLDPLNVYHHSSVQAVSADGCVVVGDGKIDDNTQSFIWNDQYGMTLLQKIFDPLCKDEWNVVNGLNHDGTLLIGKSYTNENRNAYWCAYVPRYDLLAREGINLLKLQTLGIDLKK